MKLSTDFTGTSNPSIGDAIDLVSGGRGIDLWVLLISSPIPEPGAMLVFFAGFVALELTRRSNSFRPA